MIVHDFSLVVKGNFASLNSEYEKNGGLKALFKIFEKEQTKHPRTGYERIK